MNDEDGNDHRDRCPKCGRYIRNYLANWAMSEELRHHYRTTCPKGAAALHEWDTA